MNMNRRHQRLYEAIRTLVAQLAGANRLLGLPPLTLEGVTLAEIAALPADVTTGLELPMSKIERLSIRAGQLASNFASLEIIRAAHLETVAATESVIGVIKGSSLTGSPLTRSTGAI